MNDETASVREPDISNSNRLYKRAGELIPTGTNLLSKRQERYAPGSWPVYYKRAWGSKVQDLDDNVYVDFTGDIGATLLGRADPDVGAAVKEVIDNGNFCGLSYPGDVELAELLTQTIACAEQVRYVRGGGEADEVAIRIARGYTQRDLVAFCGYHGWHDWYLAANLGEDDALRGHLLRGLDPLGVPRELRDTAATFTFNDREAFQALLDEHGHKLAAVIMEPCRAVDPEPGFLEFVRDGAHRVGALLIFDEVSIGWRLHFGGAHLRFGVAPDLAIYAKALSNGHPMAAVIGTPAAMAGAHGSFISSTYWTESVGPVAALATLRKMQTVDVPAHVARIGSRVQELWNDSGRRHGLPLHVAGYPCLAHFGFEHKQADALRTLYTQLMLARGFLAGPALYATLAHTDELVDRFGEAVEAVFKEIAGILAGGGDATAHLRGPIAHSSFRRLTG